MQIYNYQPPSLLFNNNLHALIKIQLSVYRYPFVNSVKFLFEFSAFTKNELWTFLYFYNEAISAKCIFRRFPPWWPNCLFSRCTIVVKEELNLSKVGKRHQVFSLLNVFCVSNNALIKLGIQQFYNLYLK